MPNKDFRHVRRTTVVKNPDGKRLKVGGYRPDRRSSSDKKYGSTRAASDLPPKVDLRPYMTSVENQGATNSCTANAMAGAYEYLANRIQGQAGDVSRLFIYYNARDLDGATHQDEGTYLRSCIKVLRKYGACSETSWGFDPERIFDQPPESTYEEAANFLIEAAERVDVDLDAMRSCLADGYPFAFGLQLFSSFQKAGLKGLVPMPDPNNEKHDGGHAMLCVGYSDPDRVFIVRNSWSEDWGDRGYCYIPYDYMTHPDLNGDCWTIHQISNHIDLSQGIEGDSTPLFQGLLSDLVQIIQSPGAGQTNALDDYSYEVTYEEELVYTEDHGFVLIEQVEDLEAFYYEEYEEEYEEETEEEEFEETEDSYEEEKVEEVEEVDEESEEIEDSYDEEYEEETEEEELEETEDSYEEDSEEYEEEEVDEESEETEDSYEEEHEEEEEYTEEEYEETEDSYAEEEYAEEEYTETGDDYAEE
jgi:hypothetical protein